MTPASGAGRARLQGDLPWRIILPACYRLLVALLFTAAQGFSGRWALLPRQPQSHPGLLLSAGLIYLALAAALLVASLRRQPGLRPLTLISACTDSVALALFVYATSGIAPGGIALKLGTLLMLPLIASAVMLPHGITQPLRTQQALRSHSPVDLNLAQLSQYIVKHLRESILVIGSDGGIRLINDSAALLLGPASARPQAHLGEVSPRLLQLLSAWRASLSAGTCPDFAGPTFTAPDGSRIIRAHFVALPATAPAPVIVFLEEPDLLELRAQQSRLAALARLSASIAHEVKNPVHAMSQAGQLLAESPGLTGQDRRLTQIIRTNAERVSRIIDSVLKLSRGERTRLTQLSLGSWTEEFRQEFCETMQWPLARLPVRGPAQALAVQADPGQLRQILWNLCENALRHAVADSGLPVELVYGRLAAHSRPFLEVSDRGPGVAPEHAERIFEPFFSQGAGTGMGLYLARELAQTNGATLLYQPRPGGGSTFRIIFTDPRRWEDGSL